MIIDGITYTHARTDAHPSDIDIVSTKIEYIEKWNCVTVGKLYKDAHGTIYAVMKYSPHMKYQYFNIDNRTRAWSPSY